MSNLKQSGKSCYALFISRIKFKAAVRTNRQDASFLR